MSVYRNSYQNDEALTMSIRTLRNQIAQLNRIARSTLHASQGAVVKQTSAHQKDLDTIALQVIRGEYGDGEARKIALGEDYEEVQQRVNELWSKQGGPKPGITLPEESEHLTLDEYRKRRATSDALLGAQWNTPVEELPFGQGFTGDVDKTSIPTLHTADIDLKAHVADFGHIQQHHGVQPRAFITDEKAVISSWTFKFDKPAIVHDASWKLRRNVEIGDPSWASEQVEMLDWSSVVKGGK